MPVQIGAKTHNFTDPTGLLSDCHRRIEMFIGTLKAVAAVIDHRRVCVRVVMIVQVVDDDVHRHRRAEERQNEEGEDTNGRAAHLRRQCTQRWRC